MAKILKIKIALIILFLLSFSLGVLFIPTTPTEMDSMVYAMELQMNLHGNIGLGTFSFHKPLFNLFNYLSYLFINLFGNFTVLQAISFTSVLFGSLSIFLVFFLFQLLTKKDDVAFIAALLFSFSPVVIWFRTLPLSEMPSLFFVLLAFIFLLKYRDTSKNLYLIFSLLVYGLSLMARFANLFFIPLFFISFLYILHEKRKFWHFLLFSLIILPIGIYVIVVTAFFHPSFPIKDFFIVASRHTTSFSNLFNYELWAGLIYHIINGYTLTGFILALVGFMVLLKKLYKKDYNIQKDNILSTFSNNKNNDTYNIPTKKNYLTIICFVALWLLEILYHILNGELMARNIINLIPILSLLASLGIIHIYQNATKFAYKYYLLSILLILASFDILLNYIPLAKYYYNGLSILSILTSSISGINIIYLIFSLLIILSITLFSNYIKVPKKAIFSLLIITVMLLHTLPLSLLLKEKNHYMYEIGEFYGINVPKGSILIAGKETLFDRFFLPDAEIIEYRGVYYRLSKLHETALQKNLVLDKIKKTLSEGRRVFISTESYVYDLLNDIRESYDLQLKTTISKNNVRNIYDSSGVFMNYASVASSEDILIYEVKMRNIQ